MGRHTSTLAEHFWQRVDRRSPTECWPWTGGCDRAGRGLITKRVDGVRRSLTAPRVSWELHFGPPPRELHVLHRCDNPPCVNPAHLRLGTQAENVREAVERGRMTPPPLRRPIVEPDVDAIRDRYSTGESQQAIADSIGVSQCTVSRILRRIGHYA